MAGILLGQAREMAWMPQVPRMRPGGRGVCLVVERMERVALHLRIQGRVVGGQGGVVGHGREFKMGLM